MLCGKGTVRDFPLALLPVPNQTMLICLICIPVTSWNVPSHAIPRWTIFRVEPRYAQLPTSGLQWHQVGLVFIIQHQHSVTIQHASADSARHSSYFISFNCLSKKRREKRMKSTWSMDETQALRHVWSKKTVHTGNVHLASEITPVGLTEKNVLLVHKHVINLRQTFQQPLLYGDANPCRAMLTCRVKRSQAKCMEKCPCPPKSIFL